MKHVLKQMQYRFAVIYETLSTNRKTGSWSNIKARYLFNLESVHAFRLQNGESHEQEY